MGLLKSCKLNTKQSADWHHAIQATEEGAQLLADAKGSYGHGLGEERMSLLSPIQGFREYADSLAAKGKPAPKGISRAANGQYVVEVFPTG